ncbi:heat shock factor protein isoform X3 [Eurosta solidaginis]|uniref:heat shock factor protein isoform X3 n=1 Tax=Eurosta solidaginis TaxID=178769 RepID=UPI003530EB9E
MANTRSNFDGKVKHRQIKNLFYDVEQEGKTSEPTTSSKVRIRFNKRNEIADLLETHQIKQEPTTKEPMHTFSETGAGVPAFLAKLWRLVDDPDTNSLICWSKDGRSFIIQNQAQFARELLPLNYKHNNMASFIRQLNMYGFHKITSIDNGGLKFDKDEMEFSHPCFKRNCPFLLEHIKRKIANTKSLDDKSGLKPEAVTKVLQDVKAMRGRQDSLDSRFSVMKQENEALWREIATLRQKHAKQQQIVNKLIQFLITIVQPSRNMTSVKRHMQLMIHDTPENAKLHKKSESQSESGPVIHELGEELLDEVNDSDIDFIEAASPYGKLTPCHDAESIDSPLNIERPHSSISQVSQHYDYSNQSAEDTVNAVMASSFGNDGGINLTGSDAANFMGAQKLISSSDSSVIKSVNPDGSHIFYHVTEVPDVMEAHQNEIVQVTSPIYTDENVLTTPMVREQMARSQKLKQRNKRRRKQNDDEEASEVNSSTLVGENRQTPPMIKSEKKPMIDPMSFLNILPQDHIIQSETESNSPNLKDASLSSNSNGSGLLTAINTINPSVSPVSAASGDTLLAIGSQSTNFFDSNEFVTPDMPTDIFDDSAISAEAARNNNNGNDTPTTSTAAAAASANKFSNGNKPGNNCNVIVSSTQEKNTQNENNMSLTKYKSVIPGNGNIMRDEVSNHLDNVQDELESLKDLLRSDSYSLDVNALLGNADATTNRISLSPQFDGEFLTKLFNDSDVLGPYGLSLEGDKKGSEMMSYQPMYDLSDIIDINDKNESEAVDQTSRTVISRQLPLLQQQQKDPSSALNTPYNDYFANTSEPSITQRRNELAAYKRP